MKYNIIICAVFALFWCIAGIFCKEDSPKQIVAFISANIFVAAINVIASYRKEK